MLMNGSSQSELFWSSTGPTGEIIGLAVNYEDTPNDVIYWGIRTPEITVYDILMKQELNNPQSVGMEVTRLGGRTLLLHIATFRKSIYYHNKHVLFSDVIHNYNTVQQSDNQVLARGSRGNIEDFTDFVIVHHSLQPGQWSHDLPPIRIGFVLSYSCVFTRPSCCNSTMHTHQGINEWGILRFECLDYTAK